MSNQVFPKPPAKPKRARTNKQPITLLLCAISLLVAVVAIALSLINLKTNSSYNDLTTLEKTKQQTILAKLSQKQTEFQQHINDKLEKNTANLDQLLKQTTNLSAEQAKAQARYLIELAQLNLQYSANTKAAISLLTLANHQLNKYHTPSIESLKQSIKADLATLNQLPQENKQKILAAIDQLIMDIKTIPITPILPQQNNTPPITTASHSWWDATKKNLAKLKSFVVIRHLDNPNAIAITPDQKLLTQQTILVKLNQAEWAVLNNQPDIYQACISQAKKLIQMINTNKALTQKINNILTSLSKATFHQKESVELISFKPNKPTKDTK